MSLIKNIKIQYCLSMGCFLVEVNWNFEKIFWRMKAFYNSCHGSKFETTTNTSERWFNSLKNTSQTKMDLFFSFIKWK